MRKKAIWVLVTIIATSLSFVIFHPHDETYQLNNKSINSKIDSIVYDTIHYFLAIPIDSVVVRYEKVKLPLVKNEINDTNITDFTVQIDSATVNIPITQKEYKDSTYHLWVSGYHPNLDSIKTFQRTIYRTQTITEKPNRWGVGVQIGYGLTDGKLSPYLGVGITYTVFRL